MTKKTPATVSTQSRKTSKVASTSVELWPEEIIAREKFFSTPTLRRKLSDLEKRIQSGGY